MDGAFVGITGELHCTDYIIPVVQEFSKRDEKMNGLHGSEYERRSWGFLLCSPE